MSIKEDLIIAKISIQAIADGLINTIESIGIEERCSNHNMTWTETKNLFLDEALKGISNSFFWELVKDFSEIIKNFVK